MTAEKILQSDILDILFEGRNKLYGAYELRRTYNRRIKRGIGGMVIIIVLLTGSYVYSLGMQSNNVLPIEVKDTLVVNMIQDPKKPPKEQPVALKQLPPEKRASVKEFIPIIQPDELVPKTEVHKQSEIDTSLIGSLNTPGQGSSPAEIIADGPPGDSKPGGTGTGEAPPSEPIKPAGPIDMKMADEMPQYPGGTQALVRYMVNSLTSELEPGMKYVLKAQFVINEDGNVSEAIIINSDEPGLNQQVLKAIRKMKQWKPGMLHGQKVAVRFTMPVTFVGAEE